MLEMLKMSSVELPEILKSTQLICIVKMQDQVMEKVNLVGNINKHMYQ